jgi:hypothetical protein
MYSLEGSEYIVLSIFKVNGFYFESSIDLCAEESSKSLTVNGVVINSSRPNIFGHLLGSSGTTTDDSAAPCFDNSIGELIGMALI